LATEEIKGDSPVRNQKKYVRQWSEEDYKKFYEAVEMFKD
jgi:hypothetical protein